MSEIILNGSYTCEEMNDLISDVEDCTYGIEDTNEFGEFKGRLKVTIEYKEEGDCDCVGFSHDTNREHHVICF